ncbi:siroheme decarboxylase subunit beta [Desulfotignum phosphitoxidans]|jgi:DNA-binding Lrp family transcriptional regulator|uniref:siroheme decarboxylase n=1 Tax=Desulfotignum phosphitoxidans DSM 13687 TaxID=1286635 RepID=S0G1I0_9BACT|nr:Lrp/AsnC family transcriptional regulator [Desulfotignum phosphitoxidans]EMS77571.1 HTH transcription repressor NirL [Desulfotignum phosphitoxidans DSM 13687]
MITDLEKKVIALLQTDIPVVQRPFRQMAEKIGVTEEKFLEVLTDLNQRGIIRRFGATLKHQKSGFKANAMVAWNVDESRVEQVGMAMAQFDEITHCYSRNPAPGWPYNLYTMVHAANEDQCRALAEKISQTVGETDYILLFSRKELKKTSMKYFED